MMLKIGLTGSFGTGKTFVASMFRSLGAKIIDADLISHEVIKPGAPAYRKIVRRFGRAILKRSGAIDRMALGVLVFSDRKKLKELEAMVHPEIIRLIKKGMSACAGKDVVIVDAPLLIESGISKLFDRVIVVTASRKTQLERCAGRSGMKKIDVLNRIKAQMCLKDKIGYADFVIDNDRSRSETKREVRKIWERLYGDR